MSHQATRSAHCQTSKKGSVLVTPARSPTWLTPPAFHACSSASPLRTRHSFTADINIITQQPQGAQPQPIIHTHTHIHTHTTHPHVRTTCVKHDKFDCKLRTSVRAKVVFPEPSGPMTSKPPHFRAASMPGSLAPASVGGVSESRPLQPRNARHRTVRAMLKETGNIKW